MSLTLQIFFIIMALLLGPSYPNSTRSSHPPCEEEDSLEPPECPPHEEGLPTYFPYPYNCRQFYECSNGVAVCFRCANGTVWDQKLLVCNHELVAPCVIITTTMQPNSTTPPPPPTTPSPDPCDKSNNIVETTNSTERIKIDYESDIPDDDGNWSFECGYGLDPSTFQCDVDKELQLPRRGYWFACPNVTCDITINLQPGDTEVGVKTFVHNSEVLLSFDYGSTWIPICSRLNPTVTCSTSRIVPPCAKNAIIRLAYHDPNSFSLLDYVSVYSIAVS